MDTPEFSLPGEAASFRPRVGLVLGSGLGGFVDLLDSRVSIPYGRIGGLPPSRVPGHEGALHLAELGGVPLAVAAGRLHTYEGWSAREAAAPIRLLSQLGAGALILTNAAGIVNPELSPGGWLLLRDHLNLARLSPLTGGAHFVDQSEVYDAALRRVLGEVYAEQRSEALREGVYAWVNGPEYETPAEIRMLRLLGADAVGMSTVPEAIQARALGMRVAALSCLTNYGAGIGAEALSHEEVLAVGRESAQSLVSLLLAGLPRIAAALAT